jgi:hypothetical protein
MTNSQAVPEDRRYQAHIDRFDKLSKLRAFLSMLHAGGFEHFRAMDDTRQAEYRWTYMNYAEGAYTALTIWDGIETQAGGAAG